MEFGQIIELIKAVSNSNLTEFEIQEGDTKISMGTNKEAGQIAAASVLQGNPEGFPGSLQEAVYDARTEVKGDFVKSPLVGTFYQSSSPDSAPFVKVGDVVKKGQVLGIVEAMKLMNEIESEFDGTVTEILVRNEQMVEFGQPMFLIE